MFGAMALVLLLAVSTPVLAQMEKASLISVGHTNVLDTYLSQEKATGLELRYTWEKANRKPLKVRTDSTTVSPASHLCESSNTPALSHWSYLFTQEAFVTKAGTRGNSNSFLGAIYNLRYGWHYNTDPKPLNIRFGLLGDFVLGALYNTRNSNNPAQMRLALNIDPSILATWRFNIKGRPFALRYEAVMPALGIAFSPNYGQSYYEIFTRGNYDHNVVFVSPFSGVQLHQMLTFDFRLWRTTFTVGYLGDIRQMRANSLKYHQYTHAFTFGWRY